MAAVGTSRVFRAAACAAPLLAAWAGSMPAAEFRNAGACGFVRLSRAEMPTAARFTAALARPGAEPDEAGRVTLAVGLPAAGGWEVLVGGWPEAARGTYDLVLRDAQGRDAPVRLPEAVIVPPRRLDVAILLDDSRSMRRTDPSRLRVAAVRLFARVAAARGDVATLSIVAFQRRARLVLPPTSPGRSAEIEAALAGLAAEGSTDLDAALALAGATLEPLPPSRKVAVVLSDGRDEPGRYAGGHALFAARRWPVHTVGLSDEIDEATLRTVADATGGTFERAASTADLEGIFRRIARDLNRSTAVGEWPVPAGSAATVPVDDRIRTLSLTLVEAGRPAACSLRAPDGVARALSGASASDAGADLFAPARGAWTAAGMAGDGVLLVTADSDLEALPFPVDAVTACVPMRVACLVWQGGEPLTGAVVRLRLAPAESAAAAPPQTAALLDDGLHGDGDAGDGLYGGEVTVPAAGRWTGRYQVSGCTPAGWPFVRTAARGWTAQPAPPELRTAARTWLTPPAWCGSREAAASRPSPAVPAAAVVAPPPAVMEMPAAAPAAPATALEPVCAVAAAPSADEILPPETLPAAPAPGRLAAWAGSLDWLHIAVVLALLIALTVLLVRLLGRTRVHRMAKYAAVSVLLHVLFFFLLFDLLVQTRVVRLEDISEGLAVSVEALEDRIGVALTPPGPEISLAERATGLAWARAEADGPSATRTAGGGSRPDTAGPRGVTLAHAAADVSPPSPVRAPEEARHAAVPAPVLSAEEAAVPPPVHRRAEAATPPAARPLEVARVAAAQLREGRRGADARAVRDLPVAHAVFESASPALAAGTVAEAAARGTGTGNLPPAPGVAGEAVGTVAGPRRTAGTAAGREEAGRVGLAPAIAAGTQVAAVRSGIARPGGGTGPAAATRQGIAEAAGGLGGGQAGVTALADAGLRVGTGNGTGTGNLPPAPGVAGEAVGTVAGPRRAAGAAAGREEAGRVGLAPAIAAGTQVAAVRSGIARPGGGTGPAAATVQGIADAAAGLAGGQAGVTALADAGLRVGTGNGTGTGSLPPAPEVAGEAGGVAAGPRRTSAAGSDAARSLSLAAAGSPDTAPGAAGAGPTTAPGRRGASPGGAVPANVVLPMAAGASMAALRDAERGDVTVRLGSGKGSSLSATIGLLRYGGDWDCARTAMMFLSHQLRERTRLAVNATDRVVALDDRDLRRAAFVYMTGHRDFRFRDEEIAGLRAYLQNGGYFWADDSTHFNDETFDTAFRREIARVLPGCALTRLSPDFAAFHCGYDLSGGYKGYAIPPGDKYRLDYIEGVALDGRVAVVYTRNDYGDGLNIDARTHPLKISLTDLGPAEMQEGAVRMGINMALHFLTAGPRAEAGFVSQTRSTLRAAPDPSVVRVPAGAARTWPGFEPSDGWSHEDWSDGGAAEIRGGRLTVRFDHGAAGKAAFTFQPDPAMELVPRDVLVVCVESDLRCAAQLAVGLTVGGRYLESSPGFVKPGGNTLVFPADSPSFKSETGGWAFRDRLPLPGQVEKLTLLVYSPSAGSMRLRDARIVRRP